MKVLGLSAFYHDSAAALVVDGVVVAAAQEERFTRKKHDARFPTHALEYCLEQGRCGVEDLDYVVFYDKPLLKFKRLLQTHLAFAPQGLTSFQAALPVWLKDKLFQKSHIRHELQSRMAGFDVVNKLLFAEHHQSHAASAFFPSPFEEAAVLTMDGVGEWATTSAAVGKGNELNIFKEIHFPHSLGLLYSAFTYYTGFKVNAGEYKVMGLAPYGEPKYKDLILDHVVDMRDDGSFYLDQSYFNYCTGLTMTSEKFHDLFGAPPRERGAEVTQREMDLAASVQSVTEDIVLRLARGIAKETGQKNLCLAGGVALNCVANGMLLRDGAFENIWVQPAAGDSGGALGAALAGYYSFVEQPRTVGSGDAMRGSYLGPAFEQREIEKRLEGCGAKFTTLDDDTFVESVATALTEEKVVGWFQGRMEFGPRALGARSILGDPRSAVMQKALNLKIKYRESFRPFAPSVLRENVGEWFDHTEDSPYMLMVADVREEKRSVMSEQEKALFGIDKLNVPRSEIPAVTHVDYSARIQTVHEDTNPRYYALLKKFESLTGCPIVVNTSFNVRGEPIVCTPEDAFRCFMGTEMDVLAVGNCVLVKNDQDPSLTLDYKNAFELD